MRPAARPLGSLPASLALLLACPAAIAAGDHGADREWVRVIEAGDGGELTALQTAIARYEGVPAGAAQPVAVDLVGAIHVGDRRYYDALNDRFRGYDVVLYELVAPEGTVVPRGGKVRSDNPLGAMQNGMSELLELEHQLEHVDYTRPNFVHADMDFEQLMASMKSRDEGFLKMYFRMVGQGIAAQSGAASRGQSAELDLLRAMFSDDRARLMKVTMAGQMDQLESLLTGFGGENGSALIHERNRVAMDGVAEQIAAGRRRIAVFYGAGHLEDMDERLRERFGLRQTAKEWVDAWDLRPAD
ncbi:MAG: hypothetical protein AAF805_12105 [Planctomycetota bacterium]